jgi:Signal transduction histidine kinase
LTELGLVETVLAHCEDFSLRNGIAVDVFADGLDGVSFDFDTQINIYRLIQEALNNVRKHAKASRVTIRLLGSYPSLLVRIEDDGCGADMDAACPKPDAPSAWACGACANGSGSWGQDQLPLKTRPGLADPHRNPAQPEQL